MNRKTSITQFTEAEFVAFIQDIIQTAQQRDYGGLNDKMEKYMSLIMPSDSRQRFLVDVTQAAIDGHTSEDSYPSAKEIVDEIKVEYADQGKPCFIRVK